MDHVHTSSPRLREAFFALHALAPSLPLPLPAFWYWTRLVLAIAFFPVLAWVFVSFLAAKPEQGSFGPAWAYMVLMASVGCLAAAMLVDTVYRLPEKSDLGWLFVRRRAAIRAVVRRLGLSELETAQLARSPELSALACRTLKKADLSVSNSLRFDASQLPHRNDLPKVRSLLENGLDVVAATALGVGLVAGAQSSWFVLHHPALDLPDGIHHLFWYSLLALVASQALQVVLINRPAWYRARRAWLSRHAPPAAVLERLTLALGSSDCRCPWFLALRDHLSEQNEGWSLKTS